MRARAGASIAALVFALAMSPSQRVAAQMATMSGFTDRPAEHGGMAKADGSDAHADGRDDARHGDPAGR